MSDAESFLLRATVWRGGARSGVATQEGGPMGPGSREHGRDLKKTVKKRLKKAPFDGPLTRFSNEPGPQQLEEDLWGPENPGALESWNPEIGGPGSPQI